ncbi:MAG: phosphoribosyltransferase family protein [Nanoarchaeota archaeon]|nr:phosphoribosyltransferase family protein [Nanoarchaeota archaeon]
MQDDLITRLKQLKIVHRGEVELSHAGPSDYYIDIKKAYGDAEAFDLMAKRLGEKIPNRTNCIAASGHGGLPLAGALSVLYKRNLSLVRTELKDHGLLKYIDGYVPSEGDRVAIVDDVFTTGRTLQKVINIITPTGAEIVGCYVFVKRGEGQLSVPVESLLRVEDLL